jgi:hypothetical protein
MFLFFISWWGWIGLAILSFDKTLPDKWYVALPLFLLATGWGFFMQGIARWVRDKK